MPEDIFDNRLSQGLIAQTKLKNKYGRDFVNNTNYFDKLDVNNITLEDMATDLHVMTKTENGDYISEPLNVVLSRIKATTSIAACTKPDGIGLTEAEYAMRAFWFKALDTDMGFHVFVNTETDIKKPKKLEAKFVDLSVNVEKAPQGEDKQLTFEQLTLSEGSLEDISSIKLNAAKAVGRHCDSKGWLNFKKFFSRKATKQRLQREYDDYQALKVAVAQDEVKYRAAVQSKCAAYSSKNPAKMAAIERETFETNKRVVAKYNENEKAANMELAAKIIAKCADQLPDYESMHMHYVNALIANEGFNTHTMGQTQSILGNEKEETELITYITQNRIDGQQSRLSDTIDAAKDSFEKYGAINFDMSEPENEEIANNAPDKRKEELKLVATELANRILTSEDTKHFGKEELGANEKAIMINLISNSIILKEYTENLPDNKLSSVLEDVHLTDKMKAEHYVRMLKDISERIGQTLPTVDKVTDENVDYLLSENRRKDFSLNKANNPVADKYQLGQHFITDNTSTYRIYKMNCATTLANMLQLGMSQKARALVYQNDVFQKHIKDVPENQIYTVSNSYAFNKEMLSPENVAIIKSAFAKAKALPGTDLAPSDARALLKKATLEVNRVKDPPAAIFIAEKIMNMLALDNNKISDDRKTSLKNAISSNEIIKNFVTGKTVEDIKSMQKDPKQQQNYQAVINTVLNGYATNNIKKEPANIATADIKKEPANIAPKKEQENIIG